VFFQKLNRLGTQDDILVERTAENTGNVHVPGLAHNGGGRRLAGQNRVKRSIFVNFFICPSRAAKGDDFAVAKPCPGDLGEELRLFWPGGRIAALDVINAEVIQVPGDCEFVLEREADPLGLHPVSQGRVVDFYPFHICASF